MGKTQLDLDEWESDAYTNLKFVNIATPFQKSTSPYVHSGPGVIQRRLWRPSMGGISL